MQPCVTKSTNMSKNVTLSQYFVVYNKRDTVVLAFSFLRRLHSNDAFAYASDLYRLPYKQVIM